MVKIFTPTSNENLWPNVATMLKQTGMIKINFVFSYFKYRALSANKNLLKETKQQ